MHLVDEKYHVAGFFHVLEHRLDPLLEVAAVLCSGKQCRKIERHKALAGHAVGRVGACDISGYALGHGRLANARLTDEHRIVLAAAREDLNAAAYLLIAADDGVEASRGGKQREVAAVLVEHARFAVLNCSFRLHGRLTARLEGACSEHGKNIGVDIVYAQPCRCQRTRAAAVGLAQYAQQQVLRADIAVA